MNYIEKLRHNFFSIAIAILTLTLLIVFGVEQSNEQNGKNTDVINQFYSATLKPLFTSESIDKKDVLNFALDGDLLLDKDENKVLQLSNDSTGREVIGIRSSEGMLLTDNYARVIEKLQSVEGKQKEKLDSILGLYSNELSKSIYKDENKVFVVDPNIGMVRKLLNRDLTNFVKDQNLSGNSIEILEKNREEEAARDYLVFNSDTVFQREYKYVAPAESKVFEPEKTLTLAKPESPKVEKANELNFKIDSNIVNVTLDNFLDLDELENIHFFKTFIDSSQDNLKLSFEVLGDSSDNVHLKFTYVDSANNKIRYELNSEEIGSALTKSLKIFSGKNLDEWIEYGIKMDSISRKVDEKNNRKNLK
jgi:hypothetical protein